MEMGTILKNVLIISPTENLMEIFQSFDTCRDWEMDYCQDSFSALQRLKNSTYDLIIMDEGIGPLDPFKVMDYVFHELQKSYPMVIVGDDSKPEAIHENYQRCNYPIEQYNVDALVHYGKSEEKEKKLFSLEYLNELSDNNQEFIEESIVLFKNTLDAKFVDLQKAISIPDFEEARQIAHNIKPSFSMLGNDAGPVICNTICYDAVESEIPELAQTLMKEYGLIVDEIEKQFPKLKAV